MNNIANNQLMYIYKHLIKMKHVVLHSCKQKAGLFFLTTSSNDLSLQIYGHLISRVPEPQHLQCTISFGVAPMNGYEGCRINPDLIIIKDSCISANFQSKLKVLCPHCPAHIDKVQKKTGVLQE